MNKDRLDTLLAKVSRALDENTRYLMPALTALEEIREAFAARDKTELPEYSRADFIRAIGDLRDGDTAWHDIQGDTGLGEARCRELEAIAQACVKSDAYQKA